MSRVAVLGSNALATTVQFYAAALEEATQRADQNATLLKQALKSDVDGALKSREQWRTRTDDLEDFYNITMSILDRDDLEPMAKVGLIWEAIEKTDARRTRTPSPNAGPVLVATDDAPRGGPVRDPQARP